MADIQPVLAELNFSAPHEVSGRTSVRNLWASRTGGLYVLHFADGTYYVGRSVSVVRRFAQHSHRFPDIAQISFCRTARTKQDTSESAVITRLEREGFRLRNIDKVIQITGPTHFDNVMSPVRQERWLNDVNFADYEGERFVDEALRARYAERFHRLLQVPAVDDAIAVVRRYVQICIPAPIGSEKHYWEISVLPNNSRHLLMRVNVSWQLTFDICLEDGNLVYYWILRREQLEELIGSQLSRLERDGEHYWLQLDDRCGVQFEWQTSDLVKAGPDQVWLKLFSAEDAICLLSDEITISVLREFNLNLMRQGKTPYGRYHCLDLADRLIE